VNGLLGGEGTEFSGGSKTVIMDQRNVLAFERVFRLSKSKHLPSLLLLLLGLPLTGAATQITSTIRLPDNSDWWSETRNPDSDEEIKTEWRELSRTNFHVLGINLGRPCSVARQQSSGKRQQLSAATRQLDDSKFVMRRLALRTKCISFLHGAKWGTRFYLFVDGPTWEGADRCFVSKGISRSTATASGLQLGMTPAQVIAILGKPTKRRENELIYSFSVRKKTSPKDLKEARERNPDISEKGFQAHYGSYDLGTGVVAKFDTWPCPRSRVPEFCDQCGYRVRRDHNSS
jgi:hypothetical protein